MKCRWLEQHLGTYNNNIRIQRPTTPHTHHLPPGGLPCPPKETLISIIDVRACLNTNVVYYIKSQNERRSTIEARGWQMASNGFFLNKVKPEPSDMSTSSVPTRSQSKHWIMVPNARLATCMPRFSAGHRRLPMPNDMAILPA